MGLSKLHRAWYTKIEIYFHENRFEKSDNELALYLKKEGKVDILVICLYVDDMIYFESSEHLLIDFKFFMMQKFGMTYLDFLQYFLRLEVKRGLDEIFIIQHKYTINILNKFNMLSCNKASTILNSNEKLQYKDDTRKDDATYF